MSIIDSNARWEDEDKAMAEMLDALPTPEQEAEWERQIHTELEVEWNERQAEIEAKAQEELGEDVFAALETYFDNHGAGFTRTTLADFMWEVYTDLAANREGVPV